MGTTKRLSGSPLILITAGGTGGHMFPAVALADSLIAKQYRVHFVTDTRGARYIKSYPHTAINTSGLSSANIFKRLVGLARLIPGCLHALLLILKLGPSKIASFGGHPTLPTLLAARLLRRPFIIHEQNAVLGKVNRLFAPKAAKLAISFNPTKRTARNDSVHTGMLVRQDIQALRLQPYCPPTKDGVLNILVLGGSEGAATFSDVLPKALALLPQQLRSRIGISQQCRLEFLSSTVQAYQDLGVPAEINTFFDDVANRLSQAHLVICRAGASTITELMVTGRPAILVPYPYATDDHQTMNAKIVAENGGGWLVAQANFTPETLAPQLHNLLNNPQTLLEASEHMRKLAPHDAQAKLTKLLL